MTFKGSQELALTAEATPTDVSAALLEALSIWRPIATAWHRSMGNILGGGRQHKPTLLRAALVRECMMALVDGRVRSMTELHEATSALGRTFPTCRAELNLLASYGLVVLKRAPDGPRRTLVHPTRKLVRFYDENLTDLVSQIDSIIRERMESPPRGTPLTGV